VLRMRNSLLALGGLLLVLGSMMVAFTGGTASAQSHGAGAAAATCPYPMSCGTLTSSSGTAPPGGTITLTGTGYAPGTTVTIDLCGLETITVTTGPDGDFTTTVTIPSGAVPGATCVITATGEGSSGQTLTTSTSVLITSGPTVPVAPTGEPWSGLLYWVLAAGLGLAGFGLFEVGRRRRFRSST
jgi:hypothetical protein